jgi:serine phosphatase RsbU (regulator of sigma subunit)
MEKLSFEELATTSEHEAVRRAYDARNRVVLLACVRVSMVPSALLTIAHCVRLARSGHGLFALCASATLFIAAILGGRVLSLAGQRSLREGSRFGPLSARVARQMRGITLLAIFGGAILFETAMWRIAHPLVATTIISLLLWLFRLTAADRLLVHAVFIAAIIATSLLPNSLIGKEVPAFISVQVSSAALGVGVTRRFRRRVLREFFEQRESAREQVRLRGELLAARAIQLAMLPAGPPDANWLDVSAISVPATEVGGDYYDYFVLDDDRVVFVIADVAGHGVGSGIVLSAVRAALTLLVDELDQPVRVFDRVHAMLRRSQGRMLVTAALLLLDRRTGRAVVTSAGHPPVALRRCGTKNVEMLDTSSTPLGVPLQPLFVQREVDFATGDVFVLHTDGVYETMNEADVQYGLERVSDAVAEADCDSALTVRNALLADVTQYRASAAVRDDLTIVAVRCC